MKLREVILQERNEARTTQSIVNWFRRHADIEKELRKEVVAEELPAEEVSATIFKNGTFEELATVKNWILEMTARELSEGTIKDNVRTLKQFCQGKFRAFNLADEGLWSFKHPDRLRLKDGLTFIKIMREHHPEKGITTIKSAVKGFLESKGITVGKKIAVGKSRSFGKYNDLYVEEDTLHKMLAWVKDLNREAGGVDEFMYITAARISATLNADLRHLNANGTQIKVFDKGRRSKYPNGHPWDKYVAPSLLKTISDLTGYPNVKSGPIFHISQEEMAKINHAAIEKFCPEILQKYGKVSPNHFWRHMFAQIMLRKTGWNYGVVAALGGWTVQSLEESYGKPDERKQREWGKQYVESL